MKRLTSILRLISVVLTMTGAFNLYASSTIQTGDTLCSAKTASELSIFFNTGYISITVKNINGSGENYFYKTGVSEKRKKGDSSMTVMHDVSGLSIMEVDGKNIEISYKGQNNELSNLTYNIPDPENRFVNSYSGWRGDEFGLSIGRKGKSRWSIVSTGLGMGWLATVNASPALSTSMGHSMEWTWLSVLGVNWRLGAHSLTAGLGIYWRNYSLDEGLYFEKEDGKVVVEEFSPEMKKGKSRLQTFSLQLPLLYGLRFGRHRNMGLSVGPVVNFNTGGNLKTQYKEGERDFSIKTHDIHQRPVTVDAFACINWHGIGLYARYSPFNVLRDNAALDFKSFSTGIMLMF